MNLSDLIKQLTEMHAAHGDLPVVVNGAMRAHRLLEVGLDRVYEDGLSYVASSDPVNDTRGVLVVAL